MGIILYIGVLPYYFRVKAVLMLDKQGGGDWFVIQ